MDKVIKFSQYKKAITKQEYLIWNDLDIDEEIDEMDMRFTFDEDIKEKPTSIAEVQGKSFGIIQKAFYERFNNNKFKRVLSKDAEEAHNETLKHINDKAVKIIIDGTLIYEYEGYKVVLHFDVYDKSAKKLSLLKLSTSTKRVDLLKFFYAKSIFDKLGIPINNMSLYVLATKEYKRGEIDFYETFKVNTSKGTRSISGLGYNFQYHDAQMKKTGNGFNKKWVQDEKKTIIQNILNPCFNINSFETILKKIIRAKESKDIKLQEISENDLSEWGDSKEFQEILKRFNAPFAEYSFILYPKKERLEGQGPNSQYLNVISSLKPGEEVVNKDELLRFIGDRFNKELLWYDFEGMSLPFSIMDGILPFQQVVTQVSWIHTSGDKEIANENIVIDTKDISLDSFVQIIDAVYQNKKDYYIVYNQGYENTRLKEMAGLLWKFKHPKANEMISKVDYIIQHTIDLLDLFRGSKKRAPVIAIHDLKGYSSIKNLEAFINKYHPKAAEGVKNYKKLDIQNGMMALETANERYLGIIGDKKWKEKEEQLKVYCENDVRAMIMVWKYIKTLL